MSMVLRLRVSYAAGERATYRQVTNLPAHRVNVCFVRNCQLPIGDYEMIHSFSHDIFFGFRASGEFPGRADDWTHDYGAGPAQHGQHVSHEFKGLQYGEQYREHVSPPVQQHGQHEFKGLTVVDGSPPSGGAPF